jgi:hypothetical protein
VGGEVFKRADHAIRAIKKGRRLPVVDREPIHNLPDP